MNRGTQRGVLVSLFGAAASLLLMTPAFAGNGASVTVTGGTLSISRPLVSDFAGVTLDGTATSLTAAIASFSVSDATGLGAGWHVTAQATRFTGHGHDLPAGSL